MTLSDLQTLIGALCNDPSHDRYSTSDIGTELDNTMDRWNLEAKILKQTTTITIVDGTRQYALSLITQTPLAFPRVTHKNLDLEKRSKSYFDLYLNSDITLVLGTPTAFYIEAEDPNNQYITVFPTPQSSDAGANLIVEAIVRHTSMSASTDVPFMLGTVSNSLLRPYDSGLAYETASRLLLRDPSQANSEKSDNYMKVANNVLADVVQVYKNLEHLEPPRMKGGRIF